MDVEFAAEGAEVFLSGRSCPTRILCASPSCAGACGDLVRFVLSDVVATFEALSPGQQQQYCSKQIVSGKRDERFEAYAAQLNPDGAKDAAFFTGVAKIDVREESAVNSFGNDKRRQILSGINALKGHQYLELVFLLEIPIGQRPAETLNLDQQKAQILEWAEENHREF